MSTITEIFGIKPPKLSTYSEEEKCVNPKLAVGIELEIENCDRWGAGTYEDVAARFNYDVKTDGSLRGRAYEFVSKPMETRHALKATAGLLQACQFDNRNYTDRCSVHVHVNCTNLSMETISAVALLYTVVEEILFEFVGAYRSSNIYCIPWNQCRNHHALVHKFLKEPMNCLRGWNKYTALNLIPLSHFGTVEFRQMHGTADMEKLTKWINLIGSIFKYATETELKDLTEQIKGLNTTSHYEAFFTQVLSGLLPYNPTYQQKLEEGVILAKFSLIEARPATRLQPQVMDDVVEDHGIRININNDPTAQWRTLYGEGIATQVNPPRPTVREQFAAMAQAPVAQPPRPNELGVAALQRTERAMRDRRVREARRQHEIEMARQGLNNLAQRVEGVAQLPQGVTIHEGGWNINIEDNE